MKIWNDVQKLKCSCVGLDLRDLSGDDVAHCNACLFGVMGHGELVRFLEPTLSRLYVDSSALKSIGCGADGNLFGGGFPKDFQSMVLSLVRRVFLDTNSCYAFIETLSIDQEPPESHLYTDYECRNHIYHELWEPEASRKVRGGMWANFLTQGHIEGLGGLERIKKAAPCYLVEELAPGKVLLLGTEWADQMSVNYVPYKTKDGLFSMTTEPADDISGQARRALEHFLKPILMPPQPGRHEISCPPYTFLFTPKAARRFGGIEKVREFWPEHLIERFIEGYVLIRVSDKILVGENRMFAHELIFLAKLKKYADLPRLDTIMELLIRFGAGLPEIAAKAFMEVFIYGARRERFPLKLWLAYGEMKDWRHLPVTAASKNLVPEAVERAVQRWREDIAQLGLGTKTDLASDLPFNGICARLEVDAEAVGYKGLLALMMRIQEEAIKHKMKGYLFFGDFDTNPQGEAIPE